MPDPRRDEKALEQLSRYLLKPKTLGQIQCRFGLLERTAYRWLQYLREEGVSVISIRDAKGVVRFTVED